MTESSVELSEILKTPGKYAGKLTFEEYRDHYGVQEYDASPETFDIEETLDLIDSIMKYGMIQERKMRLTTSKDAKLKGHMTNGRHRFYCTYIITIHGMKIPGLRYTRKIGVVPIPDLSFESDAVDDFKDVYGLIFKYESLDRSKSEKIRKKRQMQCVREIVGQPPADANLEYWEKLCKEHGIVTDGEIVVATFEKWSDRTKGKGAGKNKKPDGATQYGNPDEDWGPVPGQSTEMKTQDDRTETEQEPDNKNWITVEGHDTVRNKCPDCDVEFMSLIQLKDKSGKAIKDFKINIENQSLTKNTVVEQ